jgi:4-amino-4-deoxy-L-arabinose transferase-like glycosyltransferase
VRATHHWLALTGLIIVPLPLRVWLASAAGLAPDEAYYWTWSRHLALGYLDHPPMVAWLIRASTAMGGDSALAVRAPAVVLGGVVLPIAVYWLAREAGVKPALALLLPLATLVQPLGLAAGLLVTPDVPLLVAWTACGAALLRGVRTGAAWSWLAAGLALGVALLSKHSAWLLLASAAVGLAAVPAGRARLKGPWPWLGLVVALAVASPNLWWDGARGFPSLLFQLRHGLEPSNPIRAPLRLLELAGAQIGLLTPLPAWAAWRFLRRRPDAPEVRLLRVLALAPLAVFGVAALLTDAEANWPAPAHPLLLAGAVVWLQPRLDDERSAASRPGWTAGAVGSCALVTGFAVVHLLAPFPFLPVDIEPAARLRAWDDLPEWLLDGDPRVVADGYDLAAALTYHRPGHPPVADGRRDGVCIVGTVVVASSPGYRTPEVPAWAAGGGRCMVPVGEHRMRREDGRVVRTVRGFRVVACDERR